jgi:HAD superfamily hydrolase (TIGR01509 family)
MIFLFDLDGVLLDTEQQYSYFYNAFGEKYLGLKDFGLTIKGQTLVQILSQHIPDAEIEAILRRELNEFEQNMDYSFIPGAYEFLKKVKEDGVPSAIVTSSDDNKMQKLYAAHPEFKSMVDIILTSEYFTKSKPDPECFRKGMEILGGTPETSVVFEDSLHGLAAGRASGAFVVGLPTSNPREVVSGLCDMMIDNFEGLDPQQLIELISQKL